MSVDLNNALYSSTANSFKNTGVYATSITLSGTVAAGATATFTSTVTLAEDQVFSYFIAEYAELGKVIYGLTTKYWQRVPTGASAYIQSAPGGNLGCGLRATINGNVVTFTAAINNPYGLTETLTTTTVNIRYVTYTTTR